MSVHPDAPTEGLERQPQLRPKSRLAAQPPPRPTAPAADPNASIAHGSSFFDIFTAPVSDFVHTAKQGSAIGNVNAATNIPSAWGKISDHGHEDALFAGPPADISLQPPKPPVAPIDGNVWDVKPAFGGKGGPSRVRLDFAEAPDAQPPQLDVQPATTSLAVTSQTSALAAAPQTVSHMATVPFAVKPEAHDDQHSDMNFADASPPPQSPKHAAPSVAPAAFKEPPPADKMEPPPLAEPRQVKGGTEIAVTASQQPAPHASGAVSAHASTESPTNTTAPDAGHKADVPFDYKNANAAPKNDTAAATVAATTKIIKGPYAELAILTPPAQAAAPANKVAAIPSPPLAQQQAKPNAAPVVATTAIQPAAADGKQKPSNSLTETQGNPQQISVSRKGDGWHYESTDDKGHKTASVEPNNAAPAVAARAPNSSALLNFASAAVIPGPRRDSHALNLLKAAGAGYNAEGFSRPNAQATQSGTQTLGRGPNAAVSAMINPDPTPLGSG